MVKRYSVGIDGADPNGNLVKYDDYASLEAKIALLEVQLKLSEAAERAWKSSMMQACGEDGPKSVADKFAELESKLETALRECRSAGITIDNLDAKCAALAAENDGMSAFVDALLSIAWQGCSTDGAEIQDLALKHGLLRHEVYSADKHENHVDDPGNFEEGDSVYFRVENPDTDAFLAEVRAQGAEMYADNLDKAADDAERCGFDYAVKFLHSEASSVRLFAGQLRKGGNQ